MQTQYNYREYQERAEKNQELLKPFQDLKLNGGDIVIGEDGRIRIFANDRIDSPYVTFSGQMTGASPDCPQKPTDKERQANPAVQKASPR